MIDIQINNHDFFNVRKENLPDHVRYCYSKHYIPNPATGIPEERRFTCNDFHLCRTCLNFRKNAHKNEISYLLQDGDYWLLVTNNQTIANRVKRNLSADNYKRYPLDADTVAFVLDCSPSDFVKEKDDGYSLIEKLDEQSLDGVIKTLVMTPKGSRVSGNLYTTNERLNKEKEEGQVLHLSSPSAEAKSDEDEETVYNCIAKTILQTAKWQPDLSSIADDMQAWLNLLRKNYIEAGLRIKEDKRVFVKVKNDEVNWINFSEDGALMSITDSNILKSILDIKRQVKEDPSSISIEEAPDSLSIALFGV